MKEEDKQQARKNSSKPLLTPNGARKALRTQTEWRPTLGLAAIGTYVYGTAFLVRSAVDIARHPFPIDHNIGRFLLLVDVFLIGTTLLIASIGLYELFISEVEVAGMGGLPPWLKIHDLNDLKARIVSMLVLVAAVSFVDRVETYAGGRDIFWLGGGVALVVASPTVYQHLGKGH